MAVFMTPAELGEKWRMSARQVRRLCASGELRAMKSGDLWRIAEGAVEAYELAHTPAAEAEQPTPPKTQEVRQPTSISGFTLPDDYQPVFPDLWPGHEPRTRKAALREVSHGR